MLLMSVQEQFGLSVRKRRESFGWSQEKFAEISELHRTYISGIERGARNPTLTVICKLAKALKTNPGELLE